MAINSPSDPLSAPANVYSPTPNYNSAQPNNEPPAPADPYPDPQSYGYPAVQVYANPYPSNVPLIHPGQPVNGPAGRPRLPVRRRPAADDNPC